VVQGYLGVGGPRVALLEAGVCGVELLVLGVDASRRGVEEALDTRLACGLDLEMGERRMVEWAGRRVY
jgi:hypothetical protein